MCKALKEIIHQKFMVHNTIKIEYIQLFFISKSGPCLSSYNKEK